MYLLSPDVLSGICRIYGRFSESFCNHPLSALLNGNIAVQYFFVLTGFLVGRSFFTKDIPAQSIADRSIKRYFRLLPVVFAATVFTFLTMRMGLQHHLKIADMVQNQYFLKDYCNFTERLISLPANIFVNPFIRTGSIYVGPFWTIRYEFWGYIFAMLICVVFREQKYRYPEYCLLAILLLLNLDAVYVPFLLGVLVADLRFNRTPAFLRKDPATAPRRKALRAVLFVLGLYLATCPVSFTWIHAPLQQIPLMEPAIARASGLAILLYLLTDSPKAQKILSHPLLVRTGDISFEVYAFHWPLMLSFEAWAFYRLCDRFPYDAAAVTAFLLTIPVIYLTAYLVRLLLAKCGTVAAHIRTKL